jgi:DNA gyrase subunit B
MRPLVDSGYVYIAQPPLFRAKRGRTETFIRDERQLEAWLIRRAVESRTLVLRDGQEISGQALEQKLEKLITFRKFLQVVERRGPSREVILALLDQGIRGSEKAFFTDRDRLQTFADSLHTKTRSASLQPDEEHQAFGLVVEDRGGGYPKYHRVDLDFALTSEFRTLSNSYTDVRDIKAPMAVKSTGATSDSEADDAAAEDAGQASAGETAIGGIPVDEATKLAAEPKIPDASSMPGAMKAAAKAKEQDVTVESLDELVEFFIAAGKKGIAVNRYKGLGEMNPDTLWETTMDPAKRTLLQVKAEDHPAADLMFTTLMGDQVEPRRRFIEENALDVKNLDI